MYSHRREALKKEEAGRVDGRRTDTAPIRSQVGGHDTGEGEKRRKRTRTLLDGSPAERARALLELEQQLGVAVAAVEKMQLEVRRQSLFRAGVGVHVRIQFALHLRWRVVRGRGSA